MPPAKNRRVNALIDPAFQYRQARRWLGLLALDLTFFLFVCIFMPAAVGFATGHARTGALESLDRAQTILGLVLLPLACTFIALFAQTLREGLRIAGPAWRLRRAFVELRQLRIPQALRLRTGDELQPVAMEFNCAMTNWAEKMGRAKELIRQIEREPRDSSGEDWRELKGLIEDIEIGTPSETRRPAAPSEGALDTEGRAAELADQDL